MSMCSVPLHKPSFHPKLPLKTNHFPPCSFLVSDEVLDGLLVLLSRCLTWPVSVFLAVRLTSRVLLAGVKPITGFQKDHWLCNEGGER